MRPLFISDFGKSGENVGQPQSEEISRLQSQTLEAVWLVYAGVLCRTGWMILAEIHWYPHILGSGFMLMYCGVTVNMSCVFCKDTPLTEETFKNPDVTS